MPGDDEIEVKLDTRGWPIMAAVAALKGIERRFPGSTVQNGDGHWLVRLGPERDRP